MVIEIWRLVAFDDNIFIDANLGLGRFEVLTAFFLNRFHLNHFPTLSIRYERLIQRALVSLRRKSFIFLRF